MNKFPDGMRMRVTIDHARKTKLPVLEVYYESPKGAPPDKISVIIVPEILDGLIAQLQQCAQFLIDHPYFVDETEGDFAELMQRLMEQPTDKGEPPSE